MKNLILIAVVTIFAFTANASCLKDKTAKKVLRILKVNSIESPFSFVEQAIADARQLFADGGTFCGTGNTQLIDALSLCTSLAIVGWKDLTSQNPVVQSELSKALKDFGRQFPSSIESPNSLSCDLKLNH